MSYIPFSKTCWAGQALFGHRSKKKVNQWKFCFGTLQYLQSDLFTIHNSRLEPDVFLDYTTYGCIYNNQYIVWSKLFFPGHNLEGLGNSAENEYFQFLTLPELLCTKAKGKKSTPRSWQGSQNDISQIWLWCHTVTCHNNNGGKKCVQRDGKL